jgi:hypothetical protein
MKFDVSRRQSLQKGEFVKVHQLSFELTVCDRYHFTVRDRYRLLRS